MEEARTLARIPGLIYKMFSVVGVKSGWNSPAEIGGVEAEKGCWSQSWFRVTWLALVGADAQRILGIGLDSVWLCPRGPGPVATAASWLAHVTRLRWQKCSN